MPELPERPNLDQLRRQARELLRAAADGETSALHRIRAVSENVSLSAAQLAVARGYGFASWPMLRAEVKRRLAQMPHEERAGQPGTRWSFGAPAAVETAAGTLYPVVLIAGTDHAVLDVSLVPSPESQRRPSTGQNHSGKAGIDAVEDSAGSSDEAIVDALGLTDDQGTTYALRVESRSGSSLHQGRERGLISLRLAVDPAPARERRWLELRGNTGPAARLMPSARLDARVRRHASVSGSIAGRELTEQAVTLIGLQLTGADQNTMERRCSDALARAAEVQQSGEPGAAGDLPDQLTRLCAMLTGRTPADGLPSEWSAMIDAAKRTDGRRWHLDISAALPLVDGIAVLVDTLTSEPESWAMYLRAFPDWWTYSADRRHKWAVMSVHAEDDLGGMYLSQFGGSTGDGNHAEVTLIFLPRLNPLARALALTFSRTGASGTGEQVTLELRIPGS
jgi:hypothetical protein